MTKAALKGCLGLPPALPQGPWQILHCLPVGRLQAAARSWSPRPSACWLLPKTPLQPGIPAYFQELWSAMSHRLNAVYPAHQLLLLSHMLTIDGIFTLGFGCPKTSATPKTLGSYHPLMQSWKALVQGKVTRYWVLWDTSLQPEGPRQQQKAIACRSHKEEEKETQVKAVWARAG